MCPLLHDMLRSDILLAENNGNCWSRDLLETVRMLLPGTTSDSILSDLRHLKKLDWYTLETAFLKMHNDRWAELAGQVDPRSPVIEGGLSRKLVTYDKWFAAPLDDTRKHLSFIKRALGVKQSTTNLVALREAGKLPLHYYWLRMIVKLWNACTTICEPQSKPNVPPSTCHAEI